MSLYIFGIFHLCLLFELSHTFGFRLTSASVQSDPDERGIRYGKCPKTSNIKDKITYGNRADPDQTAPEGAV